MAVAAQARYIKLKEGLHKILMWKLKLLNNSVNKSKEWTCKKNVKQKLIELLIKIQNLTLYPEDLRDQDRKILIISIKYPTCNFCPWDALHNNLKSLSASLSICDVFKNIYVHDNQTISGLFENIHFTMELKPKQLISSATCRITFLNKIFGTYVNNCNLDGEVKFVNGSDDEREAEINDESETEKMNEDYDENMYNSGDLCRKCIMNGQKLLEDLKTIVEIKHDLIDFILNKYEILDAHKNETMEQFDHYLYYGPLRVFSDIRNCVVRCKNCGYFGYSPKYVKSHQNEYKLIPFDEMCEQLDYYLFYLN